MIHEVAKTWPEADGDTAEAIDFCEFYGREMLRYAGEQPLVHIPVKRTIWNTCRSVSAPSFRRGTFRSRSWRA